MSFINSSALFRAAAKLRMLGHPEIANSIVPYKFSPEAVLAGRNLIDKANPGLTINHFQAALEMVFSYLVEEREEITEKTAGETTEQTEEQSNGENKGEGKQEAISSGTIFPPFCFNTPEKLSALVGRKVRLRDGNVEEVIEVDLTCDLLEEVIRTSRSWNYYDGLHWRNGESGHDIVKVLPKEIFDPETV